MGDEPRLKRPKISRGKDDYMPGNIIEIELSNFMTFSHLKCEPGSRLNLVIGPNGSGKSSLVCAIALGLGGDPQVLGRATSVGAYVKRGEEAGYIKICLRGDSREENITIMRKIDTRNKSEWVLNGKVVPKKDLIDVIQRFNIQVNNLTQFLPQDRVCEFAKLTPIQLLEETEKAVGDPRLPVLHRALIAKSQEIKKFERAVESNKESLQQLKAVNAELERDVERVRQRDELLRQVKLMEEKLPWLKYDSIKAEYVEAKQREADAKRKLDEAAKTLNELTTPIEKLKQDKAAHSAKSKKLSGLLDASMKKRMQILEDDNRLVAQIKRKYNEMEDLGRQEASRQQRITQAKEALAAAELELANLPAVEPPRDKIEGLTSQMCEREAITKLIKSQKAEREKQVNQCSQSLRQCVGRLKSMESTKNKRLHALQKSGADKIFEAYDWVQEHRHEFKREVYGPVLIEVNVTDQQNAAYLEGHIAHYVWKAFITQDPDDRDLLFSRLKPFNVPIINHVSSESSHDVPFQVTQEMKMLGIKSRLDQVFDAPAAVREVLISQFALAHSVCVL